MNYSKNMKRYFSKYRIHLALVGIAILLIVTIAACSHHSEGSDVEALTTTPKTTEAATETVAQTDISTVTPTTEPEPEYVSLGEFKLTAYCGCSKCCGVWGENRPVDSEGKTIVMTAGGYRAAEGITVAADTNVLPFGTKIYIDGHEYTVQDRGGAVNGNKIDIYFENHQDALNFGVQYKEVFILKGSEPND